MQQWCAPQSQDAKISRVVGRGSIDVKKKGIMLQYRLRDENLFFPTKDTKYPSVYGFESSRMNQ